MSIDTKLEARIAKTLQPDEKVLDTLADTIAMVATNKRLILLYPFKRTVSVPYAQIAGVDCRAGGFRSSYGIDLALTSGGGTTIGHNKGNHEAAVNFAGRLMSLCGQSSVPSVSDEIRSLASLRDEGLITEAEFTDRKARLLS